jgi:hypothetical protein
MNVRVDDREVRTDRYRARPEPWRLEYVSPPDDGFILTLALRPGAEHEFSLIARHIGLPSGIVPVRPAGIIPTGSGDASYVHGQIRLARQ